MTIWERWVRQPQRLALRRALFTVHLWSGLGFGLYLVMISVTGSVLVYRTDLYTAFSPQPVIVSGTGTVLTLEQLTRAALRAYPGFETTSVEAGKTENQAVQINLARDGTRLRRLFHPYTGEDLGDPLPVGFRVTQWLLDLHDNLLAGPTGRRVNGIGALSLLLLCATGAVIWWPGITRWRRSLTVDVRSPRRFSWSLHSALGAGAFLFLVMWGLTGTYLAFPDIFAAFFDYIEPFDENNPADRVGDSIQYWLSYLHFGRLGGRGIPGCGRGLCNSTTKLIWAMVALVPPLMFATGVVMWWSRLGGATRRFRRTRVVAPVIERA